MLLCHPRIECIVQNLAFQFHKQSIVRRHCFTIHVQFPTACLGGIKYAKQLELCNPQGNPDMQLCRSGRVQCRHRCELSVLECQGRNPYHPTLPPMNSYSLVKNLCTHVQSIVQGAVVLEYGCERRRHSRPRFFKRLCAAFAKMFPFVVHPVVANEIVE